VRAINLSKFTLAARRYLLFLFKISLRFLNQILVKASIQNLVKKSAKKTKYDQKRKI